MLFRIIILNPDTRNSPIHLLSSSAKKSNPKPDVKIVLTDEKNDVLANADLGVIGCVTIRAILKKHEGVGSYCSQSNTRFYSVEDAVSVVSLENAQVRVWCFMRKVLY